MRLGGGHREAVDWQHVLWASREGDDAVHRGAQCDIAAGRADRRADLDTVAVEDRDVHEQVERRRGLGWGQAQRGQSCGEVVGAVVVMLRAAELLVAPAVAGGKEGVVNAARRVLDQGQDRPAPIW